MILFLAVRRYQNYKKHTKAFKSTCKVDLKRYNLAKLTVFLLWAYKKPRNWVKEFKPTSKLELKAGVYTMGRRLSPNTNVKALRDGVLLVVRL